MESQEVDTVMISNDDDGLERLGSGVRGSEDPGEDLLEDLDSYWEDINDRLMISRMVNDSIIRGVVHAVEEEAAEKVAAKEIELNSLKRSLHVVDVDVNKKVLYEPESINFGHCLSDNYVDYEKMRELLSGLKYAAREQFNRLKKEIDVIKGCNSIRRINSGSELVGLGGILKENESENWVGVDRTADSLKMIVDTIITRVDGLFQLSKATLLEWRQEQELQRELEVMVMHSTIRSSQEEFEAKLWEQNAKFCGNQSVNWLEKFKEISSLRKELDVILKLLPSHEHGPLISHGSGDVDHSHRKGLNYHKSFQTNGNVDEPETGVSDYFDAAQFTHMTRDEFVKYFNTAMRNLKRDHESTVQGLTEELISLKGKLLNEKGSSLTNKKDKEFDLLKKKIPDVILKLDNIVADSEKLPAVCDNGIGSLKDRLDSLLLENRQLRDLLTDKKSEVKCLSSQVSDAAEKMLQHSSAEANFSRLLVNLTSSAEDASIEASIREEVYICFLRELYGHIKSVSEESEMKSVFVQEIYEIIYREASHFQTTEQCEIGDSELESLIMQQILECIFKESIKDSTMQLKGLYTHYLVEKETCDSLEREVMEKDNSLRSEVVENEKLRQEVVLLKEKEKLAVEVSITLKKKTEEFDLVSQELNDLRDSNIRQQESLTKTCEELNQARVELNEALEQIEVNQMEIKNLNKHVEVHMHKLKEVDEERKIAVALTIANQNHISSLEAKEKDQRKQMESAILLVHSLSDQFTKLERRVTEDIRANNLRLMYSRTQLSYLIEKAGLLKKVGLQYRQRLDRRNSDLKMAEAEVDLLGDEVEALLSLLEKIYIALDHYSPILQHYPGIIEVLKLIKRELSGETIKPVSSCPAW